MTNCCNLQRTNIATEAGVLRPMKAVVASFPHRIHQLWRDEVAVQKPVHGTRHHRDVGGRRHEGHGRLGQRGNLRQSLTQRQWCSSHWWSLHSLRWIHLQGSKATISDGLSMLRRDGHDHVQHGCALTHGRHPTSRTLQDVTSTTVAFTSTYERGKFSKCQMASLIDVPAPVIRIICGFLSRAEIASFSSTANHLHTSVDNECWKTAFEHDESVLQQKIVSLSSSLHPSRDELNDPVPLPYTEGLSVFEKYGAYAEHIKPLRIALIKRQEHDELWSSREWARRLEGVLRFECEQ